MAAPGIAITAQEGLVIGVEEQDVAVDGRLAEVLDEAWDGSEVGATGNPDK